MKNRKVSTTASITITDVTPTYLCLEICQFGHVGGKKYKLNYDRSCLNQITVMMGNYRHRRLRINNQNKELAMELFCQVTFDEVIFQGKIVPEQERFLHLTKVHKYSFCSLFTLSQISKIYQIVIQSHQLPQLKCSQFSFNIQQHDINNLVGFISFWVTYNTSQSQQYNRIQIFCHQQRVLSLQKQPQYGILLCINHIPPIDNIFTHILQVFNECKNFFSCEFMNWQTQDMKPVEFVFENLSNCKYLVKFANNLDITNHRVSINTNGMEKKHVQRILDLMMKPGHYELVCHSCKQFFPSFVKLFMQKTLLKFNFYVPQVEAETLIKAIKMMQEHADKMRRKVELLTQMLMSSLGVNLSTIFKLYLGMCEPCQ